MYNILLVEDDKDIVEIITDYFDNNKFNFSVAEKGNTALAMIFENTYDLLILDIMLPDINGYDICKEVRKNRDTPIIFITALDSQENILKGYSYGCDDYIVKPFSLPVFKSKVEALIKRSKGLVTGETLFVGDISLNTHCSKVFCNGEEVTLTHKEYEILKLLLENKNKIVTREKLINTIWGYDNTKNERVLDSHIKNLRKALGKQGKQIKTVVNRGYTIGEHQGKQ